MIFKQITLKNFRQFRGDIELTFDQSNGKITLIIAENGVGKTTLLQAFRFCFYGEGSKILKLPQADKLLNRTEKNELNEGASTSLEVRVDFRNGGKEYYATRTIKFRKVNGNVNRLSNGNSFELWESKNDTYQPIPESQANDLLQEIMPLGLAHVYMFDGERLERPVDSKEFKDSLRESITGVLGLNILQRALELLGRKEKITSILGRIHSKFKPMTDQSKQLLEEEEKLNETILKSEKVIDERTTAINQLDEAIDNAKAAQKKVDEIRALRDKADVVSANLDKVKNQLSVELAKGNKLAVKLYYQIEVMKHSKQFAEFEKKRENTKSDTFKGLYKSVIDDVIAREMCICGRPLTEGSEEYKYLTGLVSLPQNNGPYLVQLESKFSKAKNGVKQKYAEIKQINQQQIELNARVRDLEDEHESLENELDRKSKEYNVGELQTNIRALNHHRATFENDVMHEKKKIQQANETIKNNRNQVNRIQNASEHNDRVVMAEEMLNMVQKQIQQEFNTKQAIAKRAIQDNLNIIIAKVLGPDFKARLNSDYSLSVFRGQHINLSDEEVEITKTLSTGESVLVYLSFLKALLQTINEHSEFESVKTGIIMDAALSNVDERHIKLSSKNVLNSFDQLIFLSFKRQLRNELYENIRENVGSAYQLTMDNAHNVSVNVIDNDSLQSFINS